MSKGLEILFVVLFIVAGHCSYALSPGDSITDYSISTEKIMNLKTIWSGADNAASLRFFDFDKFGSVYLGFENSSGDYHLFQQAQSSNKFGMHSYGYTKNNNWTFYGKFSYHSDIDRDVRWVDVIEPYNDNPYTIGDSIGGDYYKQYFNLEGKGVYAINANTTIGFNTKYKAGTGTKRKDPRPSNTITDFEFSPSLLVEYNKFKLGASLNYRGGKEDIDINTVTDRRFDLFYFRGLGAYSSSTETDSRYTSFNQYGGAFYFYAKTELFENLTTMSFDKRITDVKRGKKRPLQIASLDAYYTNLNSTFSFNSSGQYTKKLKLFVQQKKIYGNEPVVEPKLETVTYQWATIEKYTLYRHKETEYGFEYSYYRIQNLNHIDWGIKFTGAINSKETSYYFVPEYNKQKLNSATLSAKFDKGLQLKKNDFIFSCAAAYKKAFSGSLELVEDEFLANIVNADFVVHDFDFYNSNLWQTGVSAKIGRNVFLYNSHMQLFLDTGYSIFISDLPGRQNQKYVEVKLGMNF